MHLRGSNRFAKISGIASSLSGLGSSADIYNQVTSQGGSTSQAEAAARSGSLATWNQTSQPTQPDWFRALYYAPKPNVVLSSDGIAPYLNLSDKPMAFAGVPWTTPILNPHRTNALNWVTQGDVINKGAPASLYDPAEYLRSALIDSDWDRVFYWFAVQYAQLYQKFENSRDAYFPFANMNILSYKYIVNDNGQRVYYPFSKYDLWQFISRIVANFSITDLGAHGKCAIGLLNWGDPYHVVPYDVEGELTGPNQWWNAVNQGLFGYQHKSSVFQYTTLEQAVAMTNTPHTSNGPVGDIRVGWIQAPSGPWTFDKVLSVAVILVISYYAGAALGALFSTVFGTTTATAGATGAATTATSSATSAGSIASSSGSIAGSVASSALDEVVITGTVASSISVGTALTAGAVIATAVAPAITGATAPSIQTNVPTTSALDEVVITGVVPSATTGTVAGAITAGAVAVAAAPAILTAPDMVAPSSATSNTPSSATSNTPTSNTLEEVTVTGTVPAATSVSTVGTAIATGAVIATAAPAITNATTVSEPNTTANSSSNNSPSKGQTLTDWLKAMAKKYGLAWVKAHLASLLRQYYGVDPTQQQIDDADASLSGSGINWFVLGAAALAAIVGSS